MLLAAAAVAALAPTLALPLGAQSGRAIAGRVAAAPDGEVRMTYASRADACGDGRDMVAIGNSFQRSGRGTSYGRWSGTPCARGPARVALTVRDRRVVSVRPHVGGAWPRGDAATVDLGQVPAAEAAAYLLSLVPSMGERPRADPLLAAALADSVSLAPDMIRLARTTTLARETRRRAVHWAGMLGDASTVAPLLELARAADGDARQHGDDEVGPGDGIPEAAAGALSMLPDAAGLPALMELARRATPTVRRAAVFWLGQRPDPQARAVVRAIAADGSEPEQLRGAAIFALGHGGESTPADGAFLRQLFPSLASDRLKERLLMSVAQSESEDDGRWLVAQARDDRQPLEVRKKAAFWAGQGHAPLADLTALYGSVQEARLREHVIFVLSQRDETSAVDALLGIARNDADARMRKKALFWLAQKEDPRVARLISELINR